MYSVSKGGSLRIKRQSRPASGATATGYFDIATANPSALAWSPDSRYLAVALTGDDAPSVSGYGLAIIDTESGTERTVATGPIYGASFAPGASDTLAYARASSLSATASTSGVWMPPRSALACSPKLPATASTPMASTASPASPRWSPTARS